MLRQTVTLATVILCSKRINHYILCMFLEVPTLQHIAELKFGINKT